MSDQPEEPRRIAAVIVLYFPPASILDHLKKLAASVDLLVVVVNGVDAVLAPDLQSGDRLAVIENTENVGLATAFNQGMERAFDDEAIGFVLLLDQDSRPGPAMPHRLRDAYEKALRLGVNPACVGPLLIEVKGTRGAAYGRVPPSMGLRTVDLMASSGSLISRRAVNAIGRMRDDLFIDCIDHEWCFRARSLGYNIMEEPDARMDHDMGDAGISVFRRYRPLYNSPVRHYYIVRNSLFLLRLKYVPLEWKIRELLKTAYRIPVYILISNTKRRSAIRISEAIIDSFRMPP